MAIKFLDLPSQYQSIKKEIDEVLREVIDSQYFILGEKVQTLEAEIAEYCNTNRAIGVASGTDALLISMRALGVGHGDEVITTPFTFFATAGAIWNLGAKPVFVDILPDTFNMEPGQIEDAITDKTKAMVPVHLFGQMADMDPIMEIAKRHEIPVVEDACQSIGSEYKGKKAGSIGATGAFSFFPSKNLGGFGDGGIITANQEELAEKIVALRTHGGTRQYYHDMVGYNSRLDALQAAVLSIKLKYLDKWHEARRENAYRYNEAFVDLPLVTPTELPEIYCIYNQYTIRILNGQRDEFREYLKERGIPTAVYYPLPLHLQPCFGDLGYQKGDFPIAEKASEEVVSLPVYPELPDEQQEKIIEVIESFYKK